jgi:hypothetical protein
VDTVSAPFAAATLLGLDGQPADLAGQEVGDGVHRRARRCASRMVSAARVVGDSGRATSIACRRVPARRQAARTSIVQVTVHVAETTTDD